MIVKGGSSLAGNGSTAKLGIPFNPGVPAQVIKFRFDTETIEVLQRLAWWDWPEEKIKEALPLLMSADVRGFLARYGA